MRAIKFFLAPYLLLLISGLSLTYTPALQSHSTPTIAKKPVTIWIHGTRGSAFLPIGIFSKAKTVENELMGSKRGLHRAESLDAKYHSRTLALTLANAQPNKFPLENFYIFNWSGKLNTHSRVRAAHQLHAALFEQIVRPYRKAYGEDPQITIITHSHGGNVALNLAPIIKNSHHQYSIDRLVLLACPVQKETASYAASNLFKHVYSLHSHGDLIQVADPQKLHPFRNVFTNIWQEKSLDPFFAACKECADRPLFSERHLPLSNNTIQASISWEGSFIWSDEDIKPFGSFTFIRTIKPWLEKIDRPNRGLMHVEFILPTFIKQLPTILEQLEHGSAPNATTIPDKAITL